MNWGHLHQIGGNRACLNGQQPQCEKAGAQSAGLFYGVRFRQDRIPVDCRNSASIMAGVT